jgi:hypothetical protein
MIQAAELAKRVWFYEAARVEEGFEKRTLIGIVALMPIA